MTKYVNVTLSIELLDEYEANLAAVELSEAIREAVSSHPAPCGVRSQAVVANHAQPMPSDLEQ